MKSDLLEIGGQSVRCVSSDRYRLFNMDCEQFLRNRDQVNVANFQTIITDPPYSGKTHNGLSVPARRDGVGKTPIPYTCLDHDNVSSLALAYREACSGWIVWFTDSVLQAHISESLHGNGRYAFAPLPYVHPGRSVRLTGDGPSSWTDWIVVSRTPAQKKWGTLRGAYLADEGWNDKLITGGKPTKLMDMVVEDYSKEGDIVFDGHMGAGTTGVSCMKLGRGFVGCEIDPDRFEIAANRIAQEESQCLFFIK